MGNEIRGEDCTIRSLLSNNKFSIDYFQREYRWQEKHIKALVDDLTESFLNLYQKGQDRSAVGNYDNYYLGPVVLNNHGKENSIIDGQQRITSLTLLLISLKRKQLNNAQKVKVDDLIFSEQYGNKTFNLNSPDRTECLESLFHNGEYQVKNDDSETVKNIVRRYKDIESHFPDEVDNEALPYFVDWLLEKVVLIKIITQSERDAYTIFETMNDRGLNLTPAEMLKGFVLSQIAAHSQREKIDRIWKDRIQELHKIDKNADHSFFQSWFRAKYAQSIRKSGKGTVDEDFELIGTQFHRWFKDNHKDVLKLQPDGFYRFFKDEFTFFAKYYCFLHNVESDNKDAPHLYYIKHWGIGESLQHALLLSVINRCDDEGRIHKKLDAVAKFIERFTVRRAINHRRYSASGIKNTFFPYIQKVRNNDLSQLTDFLQQNEEDPNPEIKWDGARGFILNSQNKKFAKHLLSRISSHIDNLQGGSTAYQQFHHPKKPGKPFEIEHLLKERFDASNGYDDENDYSDYRNKIGALALLPEGTNQSYGDREYAEKLPDYLRENTYLQTLNKTFYERNPNFTKNDKIRELKFEPFEICGKEEIDKRTELVIRICKQLWGGA